MTQLRKQLAAVDRKLLQMRLIDRCAALPQLQSPLVRSCVLAH